MDNRYGNHLFGKVAAHFKKKNLWFDINFSKINMILLGLLLDIGIVSGYIVWDKQKGKQIRVFLKYVNREIPVILPINFYFKSGHKLIVRLSELKNMQDTLKQTTLVLSTSSGIMTHTDCVQRGIGGFLYFIIYS